MSVLADRLVSVHQALSRAEFAHAFGGAIALAYCTEEPRGTRDLDVNVFVAPSRAAEVFAALPSEVTSSEQDVERAQHEGQVRLWWDDTPIDLFLDVDRFHAEVAAGVRWVPFAGNTIPVLDCSALAVFKALFDRTKDWADIEAIGERDRGHLVEAVVWLERLRGPEDPLTRRMASLAGI